MLHMLKKRLISMGSKGFSLFEILVMFSIIILFAKLTIPKFSFIDKFILQNELDRLFTTFSYLQHKAIATNQSQELFFDSNRNCYSFIEDKRDKVYFLAKKVSFGILKNVLGPPSRPRGIIKSCVSFEKCGDNKFKVIFFPNGDISSGSVFLTDINRKYLMSLSCPVSSFSCVRKYKYENNKWVSLK